MWMFTTCGFFSIVEKPDDREAGTLTVRARVRGDLEALRDKYLPTLGPILEHAGSDYRFRAKAGKVDVAGATAKMIEAIDFSNFKNEVAKRQGKARAELYGGVWSVMYELQSGPATPKAKPSPHRSASAGSSGKAVAWGGVLIDAHGRLLLRRPKGDFDGYVWTFPKGRPDKGETPEQTALREVREETGHEARITGKLGGKFAGGTTVNEFFLMVSIQDHGDFDRDETSEVLWVTLAEALQRIRQTTNPTGRTRDLAVLAAVRDVLTG
jgi:8-oxo-dGTP pyrophosphatase MutT (NUDIX family)